MKTTTTAPHTITGDADLDAELLVPEERRRDLELAEEFGREAAFPADRRYGLDPDVGLLIFGHGQRG